VKLRGGYSSCRAAAAAAAGGTVDAATRRPQPAALRGISTLLVPLIPKVQTPASSAITAMPVKSCCKVTLFWIRDCSLLRRIIDMTVSKILKMPNS
jgi:hypothetical protein